MDVTLHIGDAKCGSSAIQSSLYKARPELLEQGILYHAPRPANGHFCYITLLGGKTRGDNTEQLEQARTNIAETKDLIRQHKPEHLILSAENFFTVAPQNLLALIRDILGTAPASLHVLAFLRHPIPLYLSTVQQTLKASHVFPTPQSYRRDTPATFMRWREEPQCSSLSAYLFDRKRLAGGSVVLEFQNHLHWITGQTKIKLPDIDENVSLSAEQTLLLQRFRQDFLADKNNQFHPQSNRLIQFFERLNAACGLVGTRAALKPEVKACLVEQNLPFMQKLDDLFPGLAITASADAPQISWGQASTDWTIDVGSVLETLNPEVLNNLKLLVPQYNRRLEDGDVNAALKALKRLSLSRHSRVLFREYMRQSDLQEAAHAIHQTLVDSPPDRGPSGAALKSSSENPVRR